jgi:uncharacterized protein (DUF433 family)
MEVFPGVSMDPGVRFGKPCLTGTRIDVATVVGALAAGESFEVVEQDFALTHEQVLAALRYAAHVASHLPPAVNRFVRILLETGEIVACDVLESSD